ncbi:MAG: AAA family ATPase [Actinomycetota bacterium]|nr:AAA family ATPase [Actinomycetota bacterium]
MSSGGAEATCAACGTALVAGARFCFGCGAALASACEQCRAELVPGARFCFSCGAGVGTGAPALVTPAPVAERRVTSVLFGDLVGFTSLSESRDPEEVRELLARYFESAREIVARYGGTIEKFIGDAVMAVWGVPTAHEDDAERAVRAGLDLVESIATFGESVGASGLAMRVGVVTGEVAVTLGATGQGMVAGDAVNTAARVQAAAAPGSVWVDEQTRALVGASIDFREVGAHELKGKAEPMVLFAATAVMGGVGGDRNSDRVQAPLVGRRRELAIIRELFHAAVEEVRPQLVVVSGEAGLGKSRLAREFENYVDGLSATVLWHTGRCPAYGDGVAFSALSTAVRGRIDASDDDAEAVVRDKLAASLAHYVPDPGERDWLQLRLAGLLGLASSEITGVSREELFSAWLTWFERLHAAGNEPIVWVVDDVQHADEGLLDFVEHLVTASRSPLLVVLLARPELVTRRSSLVAHPRATVVGLSPLSRQDTIALLDALVEGLPDSARDELVQRAEGNPLYAIETVRAMHDQGLTVGGPVRTPGALRLAGAVDLERLRRLAAPASLQVLVSSRLDLLPPSARSVLATASVLGQTFTRAALSALTGVDDEALHSALRELVRRDLLTTVTDRLSAEEGRQAFVQSVVRAVAYRTLSRRDRLQHHLAAADYLETLTDTTADTAPVVAQHLRDALASASADDPLVPALRTRLLASLERSAIRSASVGAPADAVTAYLEALEIVTEPAEQRRLHLAAAEMAYEAGELQSCIAHSLPIVTDDAAVVVDVGRATALAATALRNDDRRSEAWELLQPYVDTGRLDTLPAPMGSHLAREIAGHYLDHEGIERQLATVWAERSLALAEDAEDATQIARALNVYALSLLVRGHSRVGMAVLDLAVDHAHKHRLAHELGLLLNNKATFDTVRDLRTAIDTGREGIELAERSGNSFVCMFTTNTLGCSLLLAGEWDEIGEIYRRPLVTASTLTRADRAMQVIFTALVAEARSEPFAMETIAVAAADAVAHAADRDIEAVWAPVLPVLHARLSGSGTDLRLGARRFVDIAYRYCGFDEDFAHQWSLAAEWLIEAGDWEGARELLAQASAIRKSELRPLLAAELLRHRGTVAALDPSSTTNPADVEHDLLAAIAALDTIGAVPARARAQAVLASWLVRQGRGAEASPHLQAARETFTELRATAWLRQLDAALSLAAAG